MEVTETTNEGLKREYKIVVPASEIEERMTSRLTQLAQTARIPGFRPGKVPVKILRKTYGKAVLGEVLEQTVNEATEEAMTERGVRPVSQPKVDLVGEFEDGNDLEYTVAFEQFPDFELMDLASLKLERLKAPADEEQVESMLKQLAEGQRDSRPVAEARPAAAGDVLVIDFVGTVDGEEFAGGKAEGYRLELGTGTFIPGFEDQLVGANVGDKKTVKVTFPEDYAEHLAGKEASFAVEIKELHEPVAAEIDDEFAKKLGAADLEDLKKKLRENQEAEHGQLSRMRLKRDLLDILDKEHRFDLPQGMVDAEFEGIWNQFEHQREHHPDQLDEDDKDKSDDELKAQYREIAERRVRLGLLLAEIGRLNEIEVSGDELNRAIGREAQRYPGQEKEVIEFYRSNPQAIQSLHSPILEEKVVDYVLEMADVTDREATLDEIMAVPDEEGAAEEKPKAAKKPAKKSSAKTKKKD